MVEKYNDARDIIPPKIDLLLVLIKYPLPFHERLMHDSIRGIFCTPMLIMRDDQFDDILIT